MDVLGTIRYQRLSRIGAGEGMNSEVFLAFDPQLNGNLAVKEIPKDSFANDWDAYFNEAQIMFATAHAHVVRIQYSCQADDRIALAMPYFHKGSLASRIKKNPLSVREMIRVGQGVLSGLNKIHTGSFVHLDLKPTNVLFGDADTPMIADFGQARRMGSGGFVAAPPLYSHSFPPETILSSVCSVHSDIYQVGLLLYRCANGDELYSGQIPSDNDLASKISKGKFPNRDFFLPHVPKYLRTIIRTALRIDPAERYQSANEFATCLGRVDAGLNWSVTHQADSQFTWCANRADRADIEVRLEGDSSEWRVSAFTINGTERRAKGRSDIWGKFGKQQDALKHLTTVFDQLDG